MGDIAEMMLDGLLCEGCGEVFDDFDAPGYPRKCSACGGDKVKINKARSIAEQKLSGFLCEKCGDVFDDFKDVGYPRRCAACGGDENGEAKDFVDENVFSDVTQMVEYILAVPSDHLGEREAPFSYKDVDNIYIKICPECCSSCDQFSHSCDFCNLDITNVDITEQFVNEWYIVSPCFMVLLKHHGGVTIKDHSIWGRCETKNKICEDFLIQDLASELNKKPTKVLSCDKCNEFLHEDK